MKTILIFLVLLIMSSSQLEAKAQVASTSVTADRLAATHNHRIELLDKKLVSTNTIVFLGNSITAVGKWQELLPEKEIINKGVSGDVTAGVLARLQEALVSQPAKIFVMIGVNDVKVGTHQDTILSNYRKIITGIKRTAPGTKIYMQSVLPVNEPMLADIYRRINNRSIAQLNKQLEKICQQYKVTYINLHPIMEDASHQLKKELSTDGLHLKPAAYQSWVDFLKKSKYL